MITIVFKNLDKSDLTKAVVIARVQETIDRFPDLAGYRITVTLSMQNSPQQAGPDHFTVKIHVREGKYRDVLIEKSAMNVHLALADVNEHLLERLNRMGDRTRVKLRSRRRLLVDQSVVVEEEL